MRKSTSLQNQKKPVSLISDECVPWLINEFLKAHGISVIRVVDLNLLGKPDDVLFQKALALRLPLLTLDIKFVGQVYRQESHQYGLILLRYKGKLPKGIFITLKEFMASRYVQSLTNTVVVIDEQKYRVTKRQIV